MSLISTLTKHFQSSCSLLTDKTIYWSNHKDLRSTAFAFLSLSICWFLGKTLFFASFLTKLSFYSVLTIFELTFPLQNLRQSHLFQIYRLMQGCIFEKY